MNKLTIAAIYMSACATNSEIVPNYDYGALRKPIEFNQEQETHTETPAKPTVNPCIVLCKTFNELDEKCDSAKDACEAKTNYIRSSCQADCTKIAAREIVGCKGEGTCIDRVSAGESDCNASCISGASDNAKCKESVAVCAKKATFEKKLGACEC